MMEPEYYIFTGGVVPLHVTHVIIDKALKFVRARAFKEHPNIEEVICHDGVETIKQRACYNCPSLRRVIMPGVKEVEKGAFNNCSALTYIECGKLERIGVLAFQLCVSLRSVDLPSIKIIERTAFNNCTNLINAKFGKDLKKIRERAFYGCTSLERISIPMKDHMIPNNDAFAGCKKLKSVDLVEGAMLHETVAALLMEEWKDDMNEEIGTICQNLASAPAGDVIYDGGKSRAIRVWIGSVLYKIVDYKCRHRCELSSATNTLQLHLPKDILKKNVLPFLELPSHTFDGEIRATSVGPLY